VKEKLARNEPALITALHFTDPSVFELTSLMGFDGIWMDLEHHGTSVETAGSLMRAARVGTSDIMVRPAKGEFMRTARLLELGAQGIMYPRCESAAEARELVKWTKFAPLGQRGFDGGNPDMPYCAMDMASYVRTANEQTFIAVQLEDAKAVSQAEEIAAVDGVDVLFFGPADFTVLSGFPGQFDHPKVHEALSQVASGARKAGKHWGTTSANPERSRKLMEMGSRFICHGCDLIMVKAGLDQIQQQYSSLGFTFRNALAAKPGAINLS
jgi:4-hydroxy-2-oxoheptanedioate aldolase